MSAVEETLERIKTHPGVEGYVICNPDGLILRRMPSMTQEQSEKYAKLMSHLATRARSFVRDINPKDELRNLRIRTKKKEIIVTHDNEFIIIVIQNWTPYIP